MLLAVSSVSAGLILQETVAVTPAAGVPPALLEAGSVGSTNLGASSTSGSTTLASSGLRGEFSGEVLVLVPNDVDVNVQIQLLEADAPITELFALELDDAVATIPQLDILGGALPQGLGDSLQLSGNGQSMSILVEGSKGDLVTTDSTYVFHILLTSPSGGSTVAKYAYTLTIT
jgi:hypothetical protein